MFLKKKSGDLSYVTLTFHPERVAWFSTLIFTRAYRPIRVCSEAFVFDSIPDAHSISDATHDSTDRESLRIIAIRITSTLLAAYAHRDVHRTLILASKTAPRRRSTRILSKHVERNCTRMVCNSMASQLGHDVSETVSSPLVLKRTAIYRHPVYREYPSPCTASQATGAACTTRTAVL